MRTRTRQFLHRLESRHPLLRQRLRPFWRTFRFLVRHAWYSAAVLLALAAIAITAARVYLPALAEKKALIETFLSGRTDHQVRIGQLSTYWDGLSPAVHLQDVKVFAAGGVAPAVRLDEMRASLALTPLLWGEVRINTLRLRRPQLAFERLADGRLRIAGFDPVAPPGDGPAAAEQFTGWLFRQHRLEIEDGEMQWYDRRHPGKALYLARVNLTLRNDGDRHRLGFTADFPPELCRSCTLIADIRGNPLAGADWGGEIYLRAVGLDIEALPGIARELLPKTLRGTLVAELWSDWKRGRPRRVNGKLAVSDLALSVPALPAPLKARAAGAALHWRGDAEAWELRLSRLSLGLTGKAWVAGNLRLRHSAKAKEFDIGRVNLDDLTAAVAGLADGIEAPSETSLSQGPRLHPGVEARAARASGPKDREAEAPLRRVLRTWTELRPRGTLADLRLELKGPWQEPDDFRFEADVAGLAIEPRGKLPGVRKLSGRLQLERDGGEFLLDSRGLELALPRHFRAPLTLAEASGRLTWERKADHWLLKGEGLEAAAADGSGRGRLVLRVPHDDAQSPHLRLRVDLRNGNGAHAARYYPVHALDAETLKWMEYAFAGGRIESASLLYDGRTREFPFRAGEGRFEIQARVRNATYVYLPGWEPLTQVDAEVAVRDRQVLVTGRGRIGTLRADQISVRADFGGEGDRVVSVNGRIAGPLAATLKTLREAKAAPDETWKSYVPAGIEGGGEGVLYLGVDVPLGPAPVRIRGEYKVTDASLAFAHTPLRAEGLTGQVVFTDAGLTGGDLKGRLLGGETVLAVRSPAAGEVSFTASGEVVGEQLGAALGPRLSKGLSGRASWSAQFSLRDGRPDLQAEVDLPSLKSALPAPLDRPAGLAAGKLVVRSERSARDTHLISLSAAGSLDGRLRFVRAAAGWRFDRGRLVFGGFADGIEARAARQGRRDSGFADGIEARAARQGRRDSGFADGLPEAPGLHLRASLQALDADQWLRLGGDERAADVPPWLTRVSADVRQLDLFNRRFGAMSADLQRTRRGWSGTVAGEAASGRLSVDLGPSSQPITLDLAHLVLPEKKREEEIEAPTDPRRLPQLLLRAQSFKVKGRELGELDVIAEPMADGWRIAHANLKRPEMTLTSSGAWRLVDGAQVSNIDVTLRTQDAGATLAAFGVPDQMAGGQVEIKARLSWPGSPTTARAGRVSGRVEVSANDGRFLQVKEGAARLFGILDLRSVLSYLTLDFRPIFGEGFIYDRIGGTITLERGNAYTQDLGMKGRSARIGVTGRVGLAEEDFDLVVVVDPDLSGTLTLPTWVLWGPQVAVWAHAFQKIFKGAINPRITYVVKGPWKEPRVSKLERPPPKDEAIRPGE